MRIFDERLYSLVSNAVKIFGTYDPEEIFSAFEEQLREDEALSLYGFLSWCHACDKTFGSENYAERFEEYRQQLGEPFNAVKAKVNCHKTIMAAYSMINSYRLDAGLEEQVDCVMAEDTLLTVEEYLEQALEALNNF